jgi:signal transduction histidine kinase/DNA-binding response OmpR family regulator
VAPLILNVDDTDFSRKAVTRILEGAGFRVEEASNGEDALRFAEKHPDLILLDVELPDIRGLDVVRRLKAREPTASIPIVHLSATRVTTDDWARGLNVGADGYLVHPVDPDVLVATIRAVLRMRSAVERVALLQQFAAALSDALTPRAIAQALFEQGLLATDSDAAALALVSEGGKSLDFVGTSEHWPPAMGGVDGSVPLHTPLPLTMCAWTGEPQWIESREELAAKFPTCLQTSQGPDALACVPIIRHGATIGAIGFTFSGEHELPEMVRSTLLTLSEQCSQALERARLNADRLQMEDALRSSIRAREDLLAIVSHDLRNPLGVITIASAMIERAMSDDPTKLKIGRYAERIQKAARRMEVLIQDLLDTAGVEAGRFRLEIGSHRAALIMEDATELFAQLAKDKSIRLETFVSSDLSLLCDRKRIVQALSNLLGNAITFTPPGGTVELRIEADADAVRIVVSDTGPGITESQLPHLFERYWSGTSRGSSGVGLGLYIVRGIVQGHGGSISVESHSGHGATFKIMLPQKAQ